jgi:pyochelin biosynthetic protein PchC
MTGDWLQTYRRVPSPRARLICFPHAGAGATVYRRWSALVPDDVEVVAVCYPGRQNRLSEPFSPSISALAAGIAAEIARLDPAPIALFGHSMGAVVAYETTVRLERGYGLLPRKLFVSGRWPPGHRKSSGGAAPDLDDDTDLLDHLKKLGNKQLELFAIAEMRELLLSVLRADYRLLAEHRPERLTRTITSITGYCGDADPGCAVEDVAAWQTLTGGTFRLRAFPGNHFYLDAVAAEVVGDIVGCLRLTVGTSIGGVRAIW